MPSVARVLQVLIASPADVYEARDAVERAIHRWNGRTGRQAGVICLPRRWETDVVPELGQDPQKVINTQIVDEADIVIGIFHGRLGQRTEEAISGTAEELARSQEAGKPVHVYFGTMEYPFGVDARQLGLVHEFRDQLSRRGLTGRFGSVAELEERVQQALDHDVAQMQGHIEDTGPREGAALGNRQETAQLSNAQVASDVPEAILSGGAGDVLAEVWATAARSGEGASHTLEVLGLSLWGAWPALHPHLSARRLRDWAITLYVVDPTGGDSSCAHRPARTLRNAAAKIEEIREYIERHGEDLRQRRVGITLKSYKCHPPVHGFRLDSGSTYLSYATWNGEVDVLPYSFYERLSAEDTSVRADVYRELFKRWLEAVDDESRIITSSGEVPSVAARQ